MRYNELHTRVVNDRKQNAEFDDALLRMMMEKYMKKKGKRQNEEEAAPVRAARNDLAVGINWYEI